MLRDVPPLVLSPDTSDFQLQIVRMLSFHPDEELSPCARAHVAYSSLQTARSPHYEGHPGCFSNSDLKATQSFGRTQHRDQPVWRWITQFEGEAEFRRSIGELRKYGNLEEDVPPIFGPRSAALHLNGGDFWVWVTHCYELLNRASRRHGLGLRKSSRVRRSDAPLEVANLGNGYIFVGVKAEMQKMCSWRDEIDRPGKARLAFRK